MGTTQLERNAEAFGRHIGELLPHHAGEFVLIQDGQVVGTYPTYERAIATGYQEFKSKPFFVHEIAPIPEEAAAHQTCHD